MTWLFYSLLIILLATFNVLALDSISKVRRDVNEILAILRVDDDAESVDLPVATPSNVSNVSNAPDASVLPNVPNVPNVLNVPNVPVVSDPVADKADKPK